MLFPVPPPIFNQDDQIYLCWLHMILSEIKIVWRYYACEGDPHRLARLAAVHLLATSAVARLSQCSARRLSRGALWRKLLFLYQQYEITREILRDSRPTPAEDLGPVSHGLPS